MTHKKQLSSEDEDIEENIEEDIKEEDTEDEPPLEPITIVRPDVKFRVLDSFRRQSLYLIDLETGQYIDGSIDISAIGLSSSPPPTRCGKRTLGFFLQPDKSAKEEITIPDTIELDAVLFFDYEDPEFRTGLLSDGYTYLFFLKIWNDLDLVYWEKVVEKVINDLTETIDGVQHPRVKFIITTVFVPRDPTAKNKLVISLKKSSDVQEDAVSDQYLETEEDEYEDS